MKQSSGGGSSVCLVEDGWKHTDSQSLSTWPCRNKTQPGKAPQIGAAAAAAAAGAHSNAFYDEYLKSVSNEESEGIGSGLLMKPQL